MYYLITAQAESVICHHIRREKPNLPAGQETSILSPPPLTVIQAVTVATALITLSQ